MANLTEPQLRFLAKVPDDWSDKPLTGDMRPRRPLVLAGMIEERSIDVTPARWEPTFLRHVKTEWRRTKAGRRISKVEAP